MIKLVDCTRLVHRRLFRRFRLNVVRLLTPTLNANIRVSIVLETATAAAAIFKKRESKHSVAFFFSSSSFSPLRRI